jgi:hypothetical protein
MVDLSLDVPEHRLVPGTSIVVDTVVEPDRFRSVALELVILEVKKKRHQIIEVGSIPPRTISTAAVGDGAQRVRLAIPADLPAAYGGETIGWTYELRLSGDRRGTDDMVSAPVEIVPSRGSGANGDRRTSRPLATSRVIKAPGHDGGSLLLFGLGLLVSAAGFAWFGLTVADEAAEYGVVAVVVGLAAFGSLYCLWATFLSSTRKLSDVSFLVRNPVVESGQPLEVEIDSGGVGPLELRLRCVEMTFVGGTRGQPGSSGGSSPHTRMHDVVEHVVPVVGDHVRVPTPSTTLDSYPGEQVALHWFLQLGLTKSKAGRGGIAIDLLPDAGFVAG